MNAPSDRAAAVSVAELIGLVVVLALVICAAVFLVVAIGEGGLLLVGMAIGCGLPVLAAGALGGDRG